MIDHLPIGIPIVISFKGKKQLLGEPELKSGTRQNQAITVYQALDIWSLTEYIQALCCDTTAFSMGRLKGACILLEQRLKRDILYFPCRHHILEVILRSLFEIKIDITSVPDVQILNVSKKLGLILMLKTFIVD
jgi:hypothetical protein